ncbi:hypothetical protein OPQ81_001266 [Rhizoctonia solani]|nr:hypothetical protein OPQ81_001266 [Rhizoctonia solani]
MSPQYFQVLQDVNGGAIPEDVYDTRQSGGTNQEVFGRFEDAPFEDSRSPSRRWSCVSIDSDSDSDHQVGAGGRSESVHSHSGSIITPNPVSDPLFGSSTTPPASTLNDATNVGKNTHIDAEHGGVNAPKPSSGYYATFFREETRLGMGANGSVYLCQHVLNGIPLGHFAVKKIAVGDSPAYLMEILREVRLHAKLHHRNIITYHHAWLESARFSTFGLSVPTLHVLMQWAELGSLDDLILQRLGVKAADRDVNPSEPPSGEYQTREERIRAFRARAGGGPSQTSGELRRREARRRAREMKAVHLLSAEEIRSLFGDVVAGLAFLHESSFLHLDLKPGNVLLTLDEGQLIPRAMLSDFGTAQDALQSTRERSGNTGTLEYSAPESLRHNQDGSLRQITSKSDIWSLGMILHKLIYFRLPWKNDEDMAKLEKEIIDFQGYKANTENIQGFEKRRLPAALCHLLSKMLAVEPAGRPGSDQVLKAIHSRQLDPSPDLGAAGLYQGIGPLVRRLTPPSRGNKSLAASSDTGLNDSEALGEESSPEIPSIDRRGRGASDTPARTRLDAAGEIDSVPPLLVLEGPTPAARHSAGLLTGTNVSQVLSRGFKGALLICKTILLINLCFPTSPKIAALSFVIGLGLLDMWTRRLRWSFALVVLHLVFLWSMSDVEDFADTEVESEGGESVAQSSDSPERQYMCKPPPDGVGGNLFMGWAKGDNRTPPALDKAIANKPALWTSLVEEYRRSSPDVILLGPSPVVMPDVHHLTGFQEDILRCAFTLRNKWHNPSFQARQVTKDFLRHSPCGIDQIIFVPDTMGRFFLTVSRASVVLWTLEPDGVPHCCRPCSSLVAYLAVQITQQFGLSAIHEVEGALVAFVDYVLAYAVNDAGQTILLCCWVSKRATKLAPPVSEHEIRWQHSSCRAVAIGTDVIVVVRDSAAEIYPRNEFATVIYDFPTMSSHVIRGGFEMLPVTYATDTATFPSSFLGPPSIYIHDCQSVSHGSEDQTQAVRIISLVGVARSTTPLTDPSIPYFVVAAQIYRWTISRYSGSSQSTSPSHTAPPSPSHTTPSPSHIQPRPPPRPTNSPSPSYPPSSPGLPTTEKYKFVFHIHAL